MASAAIVACVVFALAAFAPGIARADDARTAAVISVPPPSSPPPASPKLEPQRDVSAFIGRPITAIDIELDDDTWTLPERPKIISVRPGQTMNGGAVRRAMEELLDTGRFARARVSARADGAGVRMVIHVAQRRLIQTLRLDLHDAPIERDELLRDADLSERGEVLGVELPVYRARMERYLARRGFPTATVTIESRDTDDSTRVVVLVDVSPGGARVLQRRVFYVVDPDGAPSPSLRALTPVLDDYRVAVGSRADEAALDAADVAMGARLRGIGYQRASLTHDLVFADNLVTLRLRVDIGPRFEARFDGNVHYDTTALNGALGLDEEPDLSPSHLVDKLKDFYVKRGFFDVEVTFEPRGGARDRTHLLVFHLVEHDRVRVASRAYPCLKVAEIAKLSEGGPSSPSKIGGEIDSYLEEDLPGVDLVQDPDPRGLDATISHSPRSRVPTSSPVVPLDLDPDGAFVADTYDRATTHVQELYRNEGYLHAEVGPVLVLRRQCDKRSPAGRCIPMPLPGTPPDECTYDTSNLPLPVAPLDPSFTCAPDAAHGIECEPELSLRIPVKLGPRTVLYDLAFTGARAIPESRLARASELPLGEPANALKLEDARRKILELYKEEGYAFADVKYTLETSVDFTRARARFDIVEGEQVIVREIVIRGNKHTNDGTIRRRLALELGKPYRTSDVRKTQERIATLNVFSNVTVSLDEPYVPQKNKTVIVNLSERLPQSVEPRIGVSTGEGFRGELAYTHANIGGDAIGLSLRARLSYLPDFLIFDPVVKQNFDTLSTGFSGDRLARRITGTVTLPEIGFGPLVRSTIDAVLVHDLEHDFVLDKLAGIPTIYYRPFRQLQLALSQTFERNSVRIFGFNSISSYLATLGTDSLELGTLLRFPDVPSDAFAERLVVTWDRRDDAFNPHKGTFLVSGAELTNWFGETPECEGTACKTPGGHTLRFTETFAFYIPIAKGVTLAAELRTGANVQLSPDSATYPDRLFFLGGYQSVRGYQQDSHVPQYDADKNAAISANSRYAAPQKKFNSFGIGQVALRGGNLMINPKVELRFPVLPPLDSVLFVDAGNLWASPDETPLPGKSPNDNLGDVFHSFELRTTGGTGIRAETPVGPVALDFGLNLSRIFASQNDPRRLYEDVFAFHFAIGLF